MSFVFYAFAFGFHIYLLLDTVLTAPTVTYDQRQTGEHNVRIDLKDLKILAFVDSKILEDYTDYDYFYDYADFTIKPISKPTTSSSVEPSSTSAINASTSSSSTIKTDPAEIAATNDSITTTLRIEQSTEDATISTIEDKTETSSNKGVWLELKSQGRH
ncbi:hypothetical protein HZH66_014444 [Vespula vulgaris]|uniref:Uncharacterized protein n=1 Tax=Vespula vulgaris TaxID=7454 RepID=A0A834MQP4_VESVU|nr:uncharacterized protein LOC127071577 isoform X1 [Vespula vulgaris]KAF7380089.1 hypothetical protein HZH66_014444 [Vespula vulgaris]